MQRLVFTQQFHVGAAALKALLEFDLILDDEGLIRVVDLLWELGRDGVVGSGILENKTLIASNTGEDGGLFDGPFSNVSPVLFTLGVLLLCVGDFPSRVPVIGELLEEGCF